MCWNIKNRHSADEVPDLYAMMTSSNGTFSALLAICARNSPVPGEFPTQGPVTRSFDVFFNLRLNKRLSKQSRVWWFETLSCPLWLHRNAKGTCSMAGRTFTLIWRAKGCLNMKMPCYQQRALIIKIRLSHCHCIIIMGILHTRKDGVYTQTGPKLPENSFG